MGSIGGMLGLAGGAAGTGFNVDNPINAGQISNAYTGTQNALSSQNALLQALQAQGGLQNQSQVYNQLQNIAAGNGPNPAQAMLNQATGQNVANQAALMAGQRGSAQNVGLMARQAAQQGANIQQQAAGQSATMQANQALGALNQAGNMANTMAANQVGQTNANLQGQLGEQQALLGAQQGFNQQQAGLAQGVMGQQSSLIGGAMQGGAALLADGGEVLDQSAFKGQSKFGQFMNSLGQGTAAAEPTPSNKELQKGSAAFVKGLGRLTGIGKSSNPPSNPMNGATSDISDASGVPGGNQWGGSDIAPDLSMMAAAHGGNVGSKLKQGGHVPGQAKVKGDSYKNDTVNAKLSPGEVVIPRSVINSKDPVRSSAEFVRAVLAKKGKMS